MKNVFKKAISVLLITVMVLCSAPLSGFVGLELPEIGGLSKLADSVSDFFADLVPKAEAATDSGTCGDNLTWTFDGSTGTLTISGTGDMKDYRYPLDYDSNAPLTPWNSIRSDIKTVSIGYGVESIGDNAFAEFENLTWVTIAQTVKNIGNSAFKGCRKLPSVNIPEGVTSINNSVFEGCSELVSATIPASVTTIGDHAFAFCYDLSIITIPDGVTSIDDSAFYCCSAIESITLPDSLTSIGDAAFRLCKNLEGIIIPESVETIGKSAFHECEKITSVTIPASVTNIGSNAFGVKGLYITVDTDNMYYSNDEDGYLYNKDKTVMVQCTSTDETYTIPDTVVTIEDYSFYNCLFKSVTIPDSVTSIGDWAFRWCHNLEEITIPDSVVTIGEYAFQNNNQLKRVYIGDGVKNIGANAFNSSNITEVVFGNSLEIIGENAFGNCDLTSIDLPESLITIDKKAFNKCDKLTSVNLPESLITIDSEAFMECINLTSIDLPESLELIGENAFKGCAGLVNIHIPENVNFIGCCAFSGCLNLTNITVDANNLSYCADENGVLFDYNKITLIKYPPCKTESDYVIPDGVTSIGCSAFAGCTFSDIEIPFGVTEIRESAFAYCQNIISLNIPDSVTSIGDCAFEACSNLTDLTIGKGVKTIGNYAFEYCSNLTDLIIGKGVKTIGEFAFFGCQKITNVTIPYGVTSIGEEAFDFCDNVETITLPDTLTYFGGGAFGTSYMVTDIYFSGTEEQLNELIADDWSGCWDYDVTIHYNYEYPKESDDFTNVTTYAELDSKFDKFVYVGLDVVEVANGELTDGRVQPGDWLEYRMTILSDMYIGNSTPYIVYDRDFFDVRVITSTTPSTSETFERADYESNVKFEDGTFMNPDHPVAPQNGEIASYNVLTASPSSYYAPQLGFCEIDASVYSNWDFVKSNLGVTTLVTNTNFEMKSDEWIASWYVRVRDDLQDGDIGSSFSPEEIWRHNINPSTGMGDSRRLADIYTADELGTIASSATMAKRYNVIEHVLLDDTYHTFIIDEPYTPDTKFNLTFEVDGETVEGYPMEFEYGTKIPVPENPSKEGYSFDGWIWKSDAGEIFSEPKKMPGFNVTATPKWIADENIVYLLEIYKNDENGQYPAAPSETVTFSDGVVGETITVDYTAPDGFTVDADKSTLSGVISATDPLVLKAYLTRNSYTVTVDIDGETTVYDIFYDAPVSVEIPSKKGHSFNVTWADVNGEAIEPPSVMPAGNLTATVVYTPNIYVATFNANGGEFADGEGTATVKVTFGEAIAVPETPVCEGYNFIGWTPSIPEAMPDYNLEFLAVWEEVIPENSCGDGVYWIFDETTGTLTISGSGAMDNYESSSLAPWYNLKDQILSVVIGNEVTSIGSYAFYQCSALTKIDIPDSVTAIGGHAFDSCENLTDISICESITSIGAYSFFNTGYYKNTDNWENDLLYIGEYLISAKSSISGDCLIKQGTKLIAGSAFPFTAFMPNTKLTSVIIPDSVTIIGSNAFSWAKGLKYVLIPECVTIGTYAFNGCSALTDVYYIGNEEEWTSMLIGEYNDPLLNATIHYNYGPITGVCGENLTWTFDQLTGKLVINGTGAMYDWDSKEETPWAEFRLSIKSIVVESGVTSIGSYAFENCENAETISISDTVEHIENYHSLINTFSLNNITVDENNPVFSNDEYGVLFNKDKTVLIKFPEGKLITSYVIPSSVKIVDTYAVSYTNLTSITIPDSVTEISFCAFYSSDCLTSISIPDSVTVIGSSAFSFCDSVTSISVDVNNPAFSNDEYGVLFNKDKTELIRYPAGNIRESYTVPDTVNTIISVAFSASSNLKEIIIPDSVTNIQGGAFRYCTSLETMRIPDGVDGIYSEEYYCCYNLSSIYIPDSVTKIWQNAFYNCNAITNVYYAGAQQQWNAIEKLQTGNESLFNATVHYAKYKLNWNVDGTETVSYCKPGDVIDIPADPVKEGYTFAGWTPTVPDVMPGYDLEFTAIFEKIWEGDGTAENPYQITDKYELDAVRNNLDAHYILMNDIEFTEADFAEGGDFEGGFIPIGSNVEPFTGVFDGNGYSVINISYKILSEIINSLTYCSVGLFALNTGTINNINMSNTKILIDNDENSYLNCGSIAGKSEGLIENCNTSGVIEIDCGINSGNVGYVWVGGVVGHAFGNIVNCHNTMDITVDCIATYAYIGGIAGSGKNISECTNTGEVYGYSYSPIYNGETYTGGICGNGTNVSLCYNGGNVTAKNLSKALSDSYCGGISGASSAENCYNFGKVSGTANCVGSYDDASVWCNGIIGDGKTNCCYDIANKSIGGTSSNCYYLDIANTENNGKVTACVDEKMQQKETYIGFDFDNIWYITDKGGYPYPQLKANPYTKYVPSTSVSFGDVSVELEIGETATPEVTVEPSDTTDNVTFTSSDENVVTVDKDGRITAVGTGTATITATTSSGHTATIEITVKAASYQLTWNVDGETTVETVRAGDAIVAPAEPVKEGYTFAGWTPAVPDVMPESDVEFTATWTANKYKVKWNIDGMTMTQTIACGSEIPVPDDPEKDGFEFAGWSPAIPETMPAEDITFTAMWNSKGYVITWIVDGVETQTSVPYGDAIPVPENPTKEGHTFNGWVPEIPATMPANDLTFTADFAVNSYYVTWIVDGAATVSHVKYGDPIVPPENPVKDGFRFAGWTPAIPASMPGYDMAFVATWETDYKVDFSSDSVTVEVGGTIQLEVIVSPEPTTPLEITWSSSDESIATVDENGLVTAVSCGSAIITAEADGKTATVTVNVAHKYTSVTTEATCTQNGFTTYTCSVCGDVYTDNVVEAKGHSYKETVIDSTCTGTGYTQYECTACGDTYTDNETPAAGHKYDPIVIKPTCTSGGYTINMCSVCGMAYKSDAVDALGHNYTEKVVEATCVSGGYTEYCCLNCGDSYQDNFVESGSHDYVATNTVAATCTENGYTQYICSHCNDTYNGDIVEAKGHTITSVTNAATCENGGYTLNVCNVCNNYTSITNQTPALGHEYIDKVVPATCESDGYTLHTCVRGDHVYTSDETSALGHNYEATEIKATCIQNGCVLNICLNCGRVNKSGATSAYGHSFNNWITVTEAGENTEGLQTRNCKNCGYTEEKILPMLQRTTYTATFVADGKVVSNVEFLKGATEITEPEVPPKHRYSGKWEEYALTNSDITINAEYELIDLDNLSGIDFGKSATYNASTGEATINLYAASEAKTMISQTSKKIPLDIVLVVDQSGSMAEKLGGKVSKQEALIESANDFVNSVYADASSNGVDHRIAVVGFGMGNRSNGYEYPAYYNTEILTTGGNSVNMKNAKVSDYASSLMPVNENGALNADIVNAINSIDAKGATAADFGLSMACNVFANNTETEGRQRIVVFMTDGEPTYNSGYEVNVANAAVQQAYQLKNTYDAFVYSVGIFDENKAGEHLVKFMNHVSSNCKTARSAPGNFDIESDKYFITVDNTDALSSVFTEIVVENITRTTDFDNITLIDTVSEYFTLTSQQEKALRISAIEKFGVKNSDITVTRNADGTTTIEIKSIHPEEIGDKFVVELDFNVSANENASVAGDYATNTDDAGIIVGDAENYECIFNAPSVNIPSDRNTVVFKVNGEIYAIKSVEPNGKITAPATDFIGDYKFTGWNIPEGTLASLPKTEFDATLVNQDCVVIWNTDSGTETVTYAPGDVIDVPDVAPDKNGDAFRRWNGEVPVTMPAESIEFTAVYGDHEHEYTAEVIKAVTCLENGETKYTCSICGGSYTETVRCAGEHTWKAITGPADKSGHTPERFKCEVCGVSDDRTLEYMLLDDENGNIMQEFNYVDENGNNCQPDGDLTITVPLDEYEDAQTVDVYRINDDGTRTKCDSRFEEGVLEFNTDHFSTYIFEPIYQCMIQGNHPDSNNDSSCDVCRKWLGVTLTWIVDGKKTEVKAKTGTELELPVTPVKEGYTFVGWTPAVPETVPGTDAAFTAVFEVNTYTVKWVVDGNETTETYEYGSEIKVPAKPEKNGYFFAGWTPAVPSKMPAKDMTFTAKFADYDVSRIKVTIATPETRTVSYRESITLYANAANLPEGAKIKWNADSKDVSLEASKDGRTCTVTSVSNGNVVITAYIVDANGDVITNENGARISDSEGITSKVTLWSIIVYAFKQMFSGNPFLSFIFKDLFN